MIVKGCEVLDGLTWSLIFSSISVNTKKKRLRGSFEPLLGALEEERIIIKMKNKFHHRAIATFIEVLAFLY